MNISYNWLKQYINIDVTPEELSKILTSIGLETGGVEEVQTIKGGLEGLVVGEVLTCADHENSDHLHVTTVNVGSGEPLQIVCGAPNVAAGQKVIVATVGTKLYSGDESFTIKRSKIRGVESFGMICAEDEIGVGTNHAGIIVLPNDVPVGTLAKDYYNVKSDYVLEVDITPNRADAISHYGVARDVAAYFSIRDKSVKLSKPSVDSFAVQNTNRGIPVAVENTKDCPRYSAVTISGVKIAESPAWLQDCLKTIGVRPINNVVDVTNYVMFEMGQALHAFDADKINGQEVRVKNLPSGTSFVTLDGIERKLSSDDLMICGKDEPMCIGGVFGGLNSGISETTQNVFLESAYFNPVAIRKTARRHVLNTDASFRYERGCDPEATIYNLKRAALLIQQVAGGEISSNVIDVYPDSIKPFEVKLSLQKVYSLIGKEIGQEVVETILAALEMKVVSKTADEYLLHVPAYRVDVQRDVDVIEDILRIYGYNNVEIGDELKSTLSYVSKPDSSALQKLISEQLTAQGFNEIMNNSLTKSAYYTNLSSYPETNCVRLMNPLSSDLNVMRQTLLFGGLESVVRNINRKRSDLKFYEFGNVYSYHNENRSDADALSAYAEGYHLALWLTGNKQAQSWAVAAAKTSVFEMKAYVENVLRRLGINLRKAVYGDYSDELLSEAMTIYSRSGKKLAVFGVVHPKLCKYMDIDTEVYYADFVWANLLSEIKGHKVLFKEMSKYPEVKRDLALLLDKNVQFAQIEKIAYESERNLLKDVYLFDVYEGKNLEAGKKSYAVSFVMQDESKTLTDKQIDMIMKKIQTNLENKLGAKLR
ncbi:phenylalanine--tRNA ligase subunit beta [Paludibacter sp. 221]|uniref:phenylalanine--tRNA ligase subunit beta n=1 Tax=Paludibacter sp. 221 TaxID=2302939 RepID=UPI0013D69A14|nr:phenylalanine--tRNA ligase subunit beta [Paludibacter sp. 221]NDV45937.1 phenylalanine--tRNA ligase subunit beta [Paludibacter sp. 221]